MLILNGLQSISFYRRMIDIGINPQKCKRFISRILGFSNYDLYFSFFKGLGLKSRCYSYRRPFYFKMIYSLIDSL